MTQSNRDEHPSKTLTLAGELTVANVVRIREEILQAFNEAEQVMIDLAKVTDIDVAGLQLLCASQRFARDKRKKMVLVTGGNVHFNEIIAEAGFSQWVTANFGSVPALSRADAQ
jgi:anti-anti-sigma factor